MSIRNVVYRSFIFAAAVGVITAPAWEKPAPTETRFRRMGELTSSDVIESSGLALSRRNQNVFWTHNDSGDEPRIFAFDKTGKHLTTCHVSGAQAIDWEDMASFERGGKSWLLLADVGDNGLDRPSYTLYVCEEPATTDRDVSATAIHFRYEDGPHNCEAVAVDVAQQQILLATKVFATQCKLYSLSLPNEPSTAVSVARPIATLQVPLATAMDISPDGRRAVIVTYSDAFQFERGDKETWQQAFAKPHQQLAMPIRRQGESICYAPDNRTLYLTSEKSPSPLWEVIPYVANDEPDSVGSKK